MISAMKTVKQCVQATAFPQTTDPDASESPTYDSLMHDHIHTSRMHHIHYYYLWVGSALQCGRTYTTYLMHVLRSLVQALVQDVNPSLDNLCLFVHNVELPC